ncbi:hypothetical protein P168DRAFT_293421 [Aspergillus campestris IBT 28561]|uniref:Uncharacterized protein n=1 Tax=Aspergillus campestris (strain IBT 28561) TaxID=1392248 RepID=A0A2I1CSD3_ASPC2|nr:uncharacterized protein P168DRAFT_293421 [Aspergillus campestris IBT 28561]PKY00536.1 hypothetical protein P168DRAFT_293421 [Aspergillus campestris IBT 28561]
MHLSTLTIATTLLSLVSAFNTTHSLDARSNTTQLDPHRHIARGNTAGNVTTRSVRVRRNDSVPVDAITIYIHTPDYSTPQEWFVPPTICVQPAPMKIQGFDLSHGSCYLYSHPLCYGPAVLVSSDVKPVLDGVDVLGVKCDH